MLTRRSWPLLMHYATTALRSRLERDRGREREEADELANKLIAEGMKRSRFQMIEFALISSSVPCGTQIEWKTSRMISCVLDLAKLRVTASTSQ